MQGNLKRFTYLSANNILAILAGKAKRGEEMQVNLKRFTSLPANIILPYIITLPLNML